MTEARTSESVSFCVILYLTSAVGGVCLGVMSTCYLFCLRLVHLFTFTFTFTPCLDSTSVYSPLYIFLAKTSRNGRVVGNMVSPPFPFLLVPPEPKPISRFHLPFRFLIELRGDGHLFRVPSSESIG